MNLKVLKSMSLAEIGEFDRLMGNVAQAIDELEFARVPGAVLSRGMAIRDLENILERQKCAFVKYKADILEKYIVNHVLKQEDLEGFDK